MCSLVGMSSSSALITSLANGGAALIKQTVVKTAKVAGIVFAALGICILMSCKFRDRVIEFLPGSIGINFHSKKAFAEELLKAPHNERQDVLRQVLSIMSLNMSQDQKNQFVQTAQRFQGDENRFIKSVLAQVTPEIHSSENLSIMKEVVALPSKRRESIVKNTLQILPAGSDNITEMLAKVGGLSEDCEGAIVYTVVSLIDGRLMSVQEISKCIDSVVSIFDDQKKFVDRMNPVIGNTLKLASGQDLSGMCEILRKVGGLPEDHEDAIVDSVLRLLNAVKPKNGRPASLREISKCIDSVVSIFDDQKKFVDRMNSVIENTLKLASGQDLSGMCEILRKVGRFPKDRADAIVNSVLRLLNAVKPKNGRPASLHEISRCIDAVTSLSTNRMNSVIETTLKFAPNQDLDTTSRILRKARDLPEGEEGTILGSVSSLMNGPITGSYNTLQCIDVMAKESANRRSVVVENALKLISNISNLPLVLREALVVEIIKEIIKLPKGQEGSTADSVQLLIDENFRYISAIPKLIRTVGEFPSDKRKGITLAARPLMYFGKKKSVYMRDEEERKSLIDLLKVIGDLQEDRRTSIMGRALRLATKYRVVDNSQKIKLINAMKDLPSDQLEETIQSLPDNISKEDLISTLQAKNQG